MPPYRTVPTTRCYRRCGTRIRPGADRQCVGRMGLPGGPAGGRAAGRPPSRPGALRGHALRAGGMAGGQWAGDAQQVGDCPASCVREQRHHSACPFSYATYGRHHDGEPCARRTGAVHRYLAGPGSLGVAGPGYSYAGAAGRSAVQAERRLCSGGKAPEWKSGPAELQSRAGRASRRSGRGRSSRIYLFNRKEEKSVGSNCCQFQQRGSIFRIDAPGEGRPSGGAYSLLRARGRVCRGTGGSRGCDAIFRRPGSAVGSQQHRHEDGLRLGT